jgi:uncharacterized protein YyaL (SSP411 family)
MEGLLGAGALLKISTYVEAAQRAADAILSRQRVDGSLPGCFDAAWHPVARWSCLTGEAQTAIVWLRLFELTGNRPYSRAADRVLRRLERTQHLDARDPGVRGGIKGSHPIWGDYAPFEYPSWAAKFFADALMLELRAREGYDA